MSLSVTAVVPERGVHVDLTVADGETLAVIGPNGAGKSTLLSLVSGALRPADGRITLDGRDLTGPGTFVPPHDRRVTTLSQDPVLFPHLTALGNVRFALRSQGVDRARARDEARRWLGDLGLAELAGRRPAQLSGGQAQRVAIARALAADPRLILLDEPMAALDVDVAPALREQLRAFLVGRTAIVVTHDALDALTLADRVLVLDGGRVVDEGPVLEVLTRPQAPFAARFGGLNLLTGRWDGSRVHLEDGTTLPGRGTAPTGAEVRAVFRPSAVRVSDAGTGSAHTDAGPTTRGGLRRTVRDLAPRGDLVRVRTQDVVADLLPQDLAPLHLTPGSAVHLEVPADAVTVYPARSPNRPAPR